MINFRFTRKGIPLNLLVPGIVLVTSAESVFFFSGFNVKYLDLVQENKASILILHASNGPECARRCLKQDRNALAAAFYPSSVRLSINYAYRESFFRNVAPLR